MDPTARFAALVLGPEPATPLDELALLVAAHAEPGLDVPRWVGALDELAARCAVRTFGGVLDHVAAEGFSGNRANYYDPRNSFLHQVIERRTGIPITLSIVTIEIGRRLDVPIVGIGMPGHFIVRDGTDDDAYADSYEGRLLDRDGVARTFAEQHPGSVLDPDALAPSGTRAIVTRLLANLKGIYLARRDWRALSWVLGLRILVPGVPLEERRELASALAADGRFLEAASVLDDLESTARAQGADAIADDAVHGATRLRARLN